MVLIQINTIPYFVIIQDLDDAIGDSEVPENPGYLFYTKAALQAAVNLWISDKPSAISTYGEINTWNVSLITDMSRGSLIQRLHLMMILVTGILVVLLICLVCFVLQLLLIKI